ncbi:DNA integrity scanning protein DisA nucleotide-binding domain protein [Desulfolithobacter sp.]
MSQSDLIRQELELTKFPIGDLLPIYPDFIDTVTKAIYLSPHENKDPYWGVILSGKTPTVQHELVEDFKDSYCDGKRTFGFRLIGNSVFETLIFQSEMNDIALLQLCDSKQTCIINRHGNTLKIYYNSTIYICENRIWKVQEKVDSQIAEIKKHYSAVNTDLVKNILSYSFHDLSINKIGATIIYWLEDDFNTPYATIPDPINLDFNNGNHQELLKQYLRNNDGAVIINSEGKIIGGKAHLSFSDDSKSFIQIGDKGTRHNSAARFSFDNSKSIVITVSEDGPVSVFSEGKNIANLNSIDPFVQNNIIHEIARENDSISYEDTFNKTCSKCGKTFSINVLTVSGWREREKENCDICGTEIHSAKCFTINSRLIKTI